MHHSIIEKLIRSKILFFDSNPIGRIFTRFSKDMSCLDLILSNITGLASFSLFRTISVSITITAIYPYMILVVGSVLMLMLIVIRKALATQRECLRMDSLYRGPIHSTFAMIVNGLVSLRTYDRISFFRVGFVDQLEKSTNVTFTYFAVNRWMGCTLDMICSIFILGASTFALSAKGYLDTDLLSFSLQILTDVVVFFSFTLRMGAEIENYFTSAQRLH